jgi:allophanate hydrolase
MTITPARVRAVPTVYPDGVGSLEIAALLHRYASGELAPEAVIDAVYDRIGSRGDDAVWISLVPREEALRAARQLPADARSLPLYGIPFALKDNIDAAGLPTTAACPEFAYLPTENATVVRRLLEGGAILIGKTNLDQFATGLNGTRSPYGAPATPFDPRMISGGSSSGSAVAVSAGLVSFALGTDTAGSGRVPAGFTATVGIKPSRGLVSNSGIVPACRSLDCPSICSLTIADGARVLSVIGGPDPDDPWSRALPVPPSSPAIVGLAGLTVGIPAAAHLGMDEDSAYYAAWEAVLDRLSGAGVRFVDVDMQPFLEAGELLYSGPWLAERLSGIEDFVRTNPAALHPVTRALLESGAGVSGADVFRGMDRLLRLRSAVLPVLGGVDALLVPTAPRTFSIEEMLDDPIANNTALGRFTTFANLLDLAAVAFPADRTRDGLPFGISLLGLAGTDARLAGMGAACEALLDLPLGATGIDRAAMGVAAIPAEPDDAIAQDGMLLAVIGAHLRGMPLHGQLADRGAELIAATTTAAEYRLFALADSIPAKPGLVRVAEGGSAIAVEVYSVPRGRFGEFMAGVLPPLAIGTVRLLDGSTAHGFVCEPAGLAGAVDITEYGGWRAYLDRPGMEHPGAW